MKILHEKSHSCRDNSWVHGKRRRRCRICGFTWSVWKKKRGRKRSRPDKSLLKKIFVERQLLRQIAAVRLGRISLSAASRRLGRAMTAVEASPYCFRRQHLLLIDALWYRFQGQRWTLYLRALRPTNGARARFLTPLLLPGKENLRDWQSVIGALPPRLKSRIVAVVSDGWRGVERIAKENGWILQRCHFHLIAQLQVNRGKWKQLPDQNFREQIYLTARKLLTAKTHIRSYQAQLIRLTSHSQCPKRLRKIIREYLRRLKYFRSYLRYPEFNIPTTTNAIESMNKLIRQQCAHLKTPRALERWAETFLKIRSAITCNGAKTPQN